MNATTKTCRDTRWRRCGLIGLGFFVLYFVLQQQKAADALASSLLDVVSCAETVELSPKSGSEIAESILEQSYREAFSMLETCPPHQSLMQCIGAIVQVKKQHNAGSKRNTSLVADALPARPWWFETLLRDAERSAIAGHWHGLASRDPPIHFCTIEKVATTQWRRVFAQLRSSRCAQYNPVERDCCPFASDYCFGDDWKELEKLSKKTMVFLRDPLERFLSAYLNKCEGSENDRQWCKPTVLFSDFTDQNHLIKGMTQRDRFSAYADVAPLHWDLHFYPQSFYCDGLFRTIDTYDFVGKMDSEFFSYLDNITLLADKDSSKAGRMRNVVQKVFKTRWEQTNKGTSIQEGNTGTETQAPAHVLEYYTARTVRRVLEYTALDYVTLGMEVPEWALTMLEQEHVAANSPTSEETIRL